MTKSSDQNGSLSPALAIAVITGTMAINALVGQKFSPSPGHPKTLSWYLRLRKPPFTPPGPVFALAWPLIEGALSYGGYRLMRQPRSGPRNLAVALWGLNMAMIGGWSALFFGRKALGLSTVAAGVMTGAATAYAATTAKVDRQAAWTALPLIAWLGFATTLAEEVWRRNDT